VLVGNRCSPSADGIDNDKPSTTFTEPTKSAREVRCSHHGAVRNQRIGVREQATIIVNRLRKARTSTFRALIGDADSVLVVVGRFLALLELYREHVVVFDQVAPLGDLTIRWTGSDDGDVEVTDEFDVEREVDQAPPPDKAEQEQS
jgi:chromatin segregation and condensation protein Rec8/ScpA/Scc1 (kleisin family)